MGQPGALILNPTAIAHQEPSAAAARRLRRVLHRARRRRRRRLPLGVAAIRPARTRFLQMLCFLELCASCCIQSFSSGEFGIQRWGIQHSFFFFFAPIWCAHCDLLIDRLIDCPCEQCSVQRLQPCLKMSAILILTMGNSF